VAPICHPDNPKVYVEIPFESKAAANAAVEQLNGMLKYATGLEFGEEATAAPPGIRSPINPGKSCPSLAAIGQSPVTHYEGWY
jgi:hypothetical protein